MIDAHFHCWQLDRGDYGWLTPALAPIWRDVTVPDWARHARAHGIGSGLLVQAAPTEAETHFLLAQADQHAEVLGVVGWVDLLAADAVDRIGQLAQHPRLKGLRPMLQDIANPDWILQPALGPALQAMAGHDLVLDALVRPVHLPRIRTLIGQHPQLRVVIDHGAKPGLQASCEDWAAGLREVASATDAGRVACKLSGLWTELADRQDLAVLDAWCEVLLSVWGPQRLIWGSDWPVLELAATYAGWWRETHTLLSPLSPAERDAILGGNAARVYQLSLQRT